MGPETPAPTRGEAGMASSLVITWGLGPPERRHRAEIPDLIAIKSQGGLPQSGEADFPGTFPGRRMPHPTSRGISRGAPMPWGFPGGFPVNLAIALNIPGNLEAASDAPWNFPGNWRPHPGSREIPREIQHPGNSQGNSPGDFLGTSGAAAGFRCFLPFWWFGAVRCGGYSAYKVYP